MNGKVEQVGAVKFNVNGKPYFTLKIGREWFNTSGSMDDQEKIQGHMISYTVTQPKKGTYNAWINIDAIEAPVVERVNEPVVLNGNGPRYATNDQRVPTWDDYASIMRSAHSVALELEPDVTKPDTLHGENARLVVTERSAARAAMVNTVIIALSNGKIALPEEGV